MNKYQEALHKLVKHIDFPNSPQRAFDPKKDEPRKYYIALQELVDKATPKKPISKRIYYNCHNGECDKTFFYYCPICNFHSVDKDYANFCPNCGQALDWSDKDEK